MSEVATAYVRIEPTFKGVQAKIEQEMGGAGESGGKSFGSGFAKVLGGAGQVIAGAAKLTAGAVAAGSTAVAGLVKSATESYGEYEQLVGGLETMFEDLSWDVEENAKRAYATAGVSANDYMETVMGFSAALTSSLMAGEGNISRAADLSDQIVSDMSDNANKMGSSMESIQNAYAGFAKQNYTMLDNLKLGYGGTKTEMQRLLDDASKLSGIEYNIDSFADVTEAIHVIQNEMGITGTTAKEASTTIQGSLSSLAASWQNVLAGMGNSEADMGALIDTLVGNAETFIGNVMPIVEQALTGVSTMVADLAPVIAEKIPALLEAVLPMLLTSGAQIIETLGEGLLAAIPVLMPTITQLIIDLSTMLVEMLPQLIEVGATVIVELALGIAQALPELIPTIVEVVLTITEYLIDNIDLLIDAALQLMIGLATGLVNALPILIEKAPIIITKLFNALVAAIPKIIEAGQKIITVIKEGIDQMLPGLLAKGAELINKLKEKIMQKIEEFKNVGKNIIDGIKQGISDAWEGLTSWFSEKLSGLVEGVKDLFKIQSPSKVFADEVGEMIPLGIAKGIQNGMGVLDKTMVAMTNGVIDAGISTTMSSVVSAVGSPDNGTVGAIYKLIAEYLPEIASATDQKIVLEGDAGRLFRLMQRESIRNTQIVGTDAVLSSM